MKAIRLVLVVQLGMLAGGALAEEAVPVESAPEPVAAPAPVPESAARRHRGVHVHLEGGIGALRTEASGGSTGVTLSGPGGFFSAAVGGAITPNVILGAEVWSAGAFQPDVSSGSTTTSGMHDSALGVGGLGPTVRLYIAPESANVFLSFTPSMTWLGWFRVVNDEATHTSTRTGVGARLAVGKEWWVGSSWGLGISGSLLVSSNEDYDTNPATWRTVAGSINFSASFH